MEIFGKNCKRKEWLSKTETVPKGMRTKKTQGLRLKEISKISTGRKKYSSARVMVLSDDTDLTTSFAQIVDPFKLLTIFIDAPKHKRAYTAKE